MRGLNQTISRLKALRHGLEAAAESDNQRLVAFKDFGSNPGRLKAWAHIPDHLPRGAPIVVVLHGCTQTAGGYDRHAGWSSAADRNGFAVLFPEQQRANNPNLCFNWYTAENASRGSGEALSIRQMVAALQARLGASPRPVFVTGLSAGGAMAAVMLATYPDVFAGGSVIAGLPFGTARSVPQAFERMRGQGGPSPDGLAALVRAASAHNGEWPVLSVWHGDSDATVDPSNAHALVEQWRGVHGASARFTEVRVNHYTHRLWRDSSGRDVIEEYVIHGMGHGTPLDSSSPYGETAGPYMLDAGISSTQGSLAFWGIAGRAPVADTPRPLVPARHARAQPHSAAGTRPVEPAASGVQKTIEDALRAAGLLR